MAYGSKGNRGTVYLVLALFILIAAVVVYVKFFAGFPLNLLSFSPISGGTATSLSYVSIFSNYPALNGPAYLATITLNGAGQNFTGFNAKQLNSSYPSGSQVSINTGVSFYGYKFTYNTAPFVNLYQWNIQALAIPITFQCAVGVSCVYGLNNGVSTYSIVLACPLGSCGTPNVEQNIQNSYIASCTAQGGYAILLSTTVTPNSGAGAGAMQCSKVFSSPFTNLYQSNGGYTNLFNVSISLTNGTQIGTINLNYNNPSGSIAGQLYAQISGYTNSGFNINTQQLPDVAYLQGSNRYILVAPISSVSGVTGAESATLPSGVFSSPVKQLSNGNLYSNQSLVALNNLNSQVYSYILNQAGIQGNLYAKMNIQSFNTNQPYGILNLTSTPTYYAEVQLVAKFQTLGVGVPVAKPVISSVSPNPLTIGSAVSLPVTLTVANQGGASGSAYITVSCNGQQFTGSNFNVPSSGSTQTQVTITSPINPSNGTKSYQCAAIAYSTTGAVYQSPAYDFNEVVNAQCSPGTIYVNPNTCDPITTIAPTTVCQTYGCNVNTQTTTITTCRTGYAPAANGMCEPTGNCPVGYTLNTTATPPICVPGQNNWFANIPWDWVIVAFVIIIGGIALFVKSSKGGGGKKGLSYSKPNNSEVAKYVFYTIMTVAFLYISLLYLFYIIVFGVIVFAGYVILKMSGKLPKKLW